MIRLLAVWILLGAIAAADPVFVDSQISESGKLKISRYDDKETGLHALFLGTPAQKKGTLLYSYDRRATVTFSPDDSFIVVDDYYASNASSLIVFRKGKDQKYQELKLGALGERVSALIAEHYHLSAKEPFGHFYLVSRDWQDDHTLSLRAWGYGEAGTIDDWICAYDILKDKLIVSKDTLKEAKFKKRDDPAGAPANRGR